MNPSAVRFPDVEIARASSVYQAQLSVVLDEVVQFETCDLTRSLIGLPDTAFEDCVLVDFSVMASQLSYHIPFTVGYRFRMLGDAACIDLMRFFSAHAGFSYPL